MRERHFLWQKRNVHLRDDYFQIRSLRGFVELVYIRPGPARNKNRPDGAGARLGLLLRRRHFESVPFGLPKLDNRPVFRRPQVHEQGKYLQVTLRVCPVLRTWTALPPTRTSSPSAFAAITPRGPSIAPFKGLMMSGYRLLKL